MCCTAFVGCSKDNAEVQPDGQLPETISLDIKICPSTNGSRAGMGNPVDEEGEVNELIYAIFKDGNRVSDIVHLTGEGFKKQDGSSYHTGDTYKITNLDTKWFIGGKTEILVVANPNDTERVFFLDDKNGLNAWKAEAFSSKMNEDVKKNPDYALVPPTMAGYLKVDRVASPVITIPVEHIYSRIWFTFGWQGQPQSDEIIIDEVRVEHLMFGTLVFNSSTEVGGNDPGEFKEWGSVSIKKEGNENPFMACLDPKDGKFHLGQSPQMSLTKDTRNQYNVLSRYPRQDDGQPDLNKTPLRYYVYCYQWDGTSIKDDPIITIDYHFIKNNKTVYKRASAPMYDPNYKPGKRHHGILRNYTYQVYCYINTTTNKLDLQVTARPWIEEIVDDIPAFE